MMTPQQIETLKDDFLSWSGGSKPETRHEITVYVDYARSVHLDPEEVRVALMDWMDEDDDSV